VHRSTQCLISLHCWKVMRPRLRRPKLSGQWDLCRRSVDLWPDCRPGRCSRGGLALDREFRIGPVATKTGPIRPTTKEPGSRSRLPAIFCTPLLPELRTLLHSTTALSSSFSSNGAGLWRGWPGGRSPMVWNPASTLARRARSSSRPCPEEREGAPGWDTLPSKRLTVGHARRTRGGDELGSSACPFALLKAAPQDKGCCAPQNRRCGW